MTLRPRVLLIVASALAALAGGEASAATSSLIESGDDAVTVLDPAGVERLGDGQVRRVQIIRVQKSILADGPPQPGYVATQTDYDCVHLRYRWRGFSAYARSGERLLHKDNDDPAWAQVKDNTEATVAARIVCDGPATSGVFAADSVGQLVSSLMRAWDPADAPAQPAPPEAPARKKPLRTHP